MNHIRLGTEAYYIFLCIVSGDKYHFDVILCFGNV